jgi:hypothetical protein
VKRVALVAMLLVLLGTAVEARPEPTGSALPGLGPYDEMMTAQMNARTELEAATADGDDSSGNGVFYGLGIRIRPVANGASLFHTGSIPGTSTLAVRTADGFAWVVAFNSRPQDRNGFRRDVERGLSAAKGKVKRWPDGDLFGHNQ